MAKKRKDPTLETLRGARGMARERVLREQGLSGWRHRATRFDDRRAKGASEGARDTKAARRRYGNER